MKKVLKFLDDNCLFIWAIFLLLFIPLYPKIPLVDVLPGYIVRLRLEDIFVGIAFIFWLIWLLRGKIKFDFPIRYLVLAYLGIGAISILWNVLTTGWIPGNLLHIGKSVLHLARYTEYFFVGFLLYSSCTTLKKFKIAIGAIFTSLALASIYAIGQKYFYWPVFSTMNREFSKGIVLYLTEHARVQSTFGGHYDFAAYLVIVLPITLAVITAIKKKWVKIGAILIHFLGLWGLVVSASRTSFIAYMAAIAIGIVVFSWSRPLKNNSTSPTKNYWWKNLGRMFSLGIGYLLISLAIVFYFGDDLAERLVQPLSSNKEVMEVYRDFVAWRDKDGKLKDFINQLKPPENGQGITATDQEPAMAAVIVASDTNPRPVDVYVDVPDIELVATETATGSVVTVVEKERTWSANAQKYGLSVAIRLDALWPWAIKGLLRSPLVGSGFGTLNKEFADVFTEADSTDNNYLRLLGETGLLGFMVYMAIIIWAMVVAVQNWKKQNNRWVRVFSLGALTGIIALLINATFIDVFASSKVAFTLWLIVSLIFASQESFTKRKNIPKQERGLVSLPWVDKKSSSKVNNKEIPWQVREQIKEANELKIENQPTIQLQAKKKRKKRQAGKKAKN